MHVEDVSEILDKSNIFVHSRLRKTLQLKDSVWKPTFKDPKSLTFLKEKKVKEDEVNSKKQRFWILNIKIQILPF